MILTFTTNVDDFSLFTSKEKTTDGDSNNSALLLYQRNVIDASSHQGNDNNTLMTFNDLAYAGSGSATPTTSYLGDTRKYMLKYAIFRTQPKQNEFDFNSYSYSQSLSFITLILLPLFELSSSTTYNTSNSHDRG